VFLTDITRNKDELNINLQEANCLVKEMFHNVQSCRKETATAITHDGTIPNLRTQKPWMFNTQKNRSCHTAVIDHLKCKNLLLRAFANLRKVTISYVMPACRHETTRRPLYGFWWHL